jgi:uncharacterized protein
MTVLLCPRAADLVAALQLRPHPEGGFYNEVFRSTHSVSTSDGRPARPALTTIDFLLARGQFSAWHRVASDEVWHLLEGQALRLWLAPPALDVFTAVDLTTVNASTNTSASTTPRYVVPAGWWQAAEPVGDFAYVGATVGPGFDFADFDFGRDHQPLGAALQTLAPELTRLL